ncbi:pyridoxal phosphate-dependent aminotransferase [Aerococcus agrisoli]|uniref:Aminotransferase n=1 Tax=Aerococcus agrisoli TaxID=2487350 RepID=A0A3N4GKZ1_9LACT|nr:pyridoxal phosphate-dependent aminotransferase [Aerococcus agrisoli]RPA61256.1 pyridoxal phosphate-dependent aminotransferase [Aerococcus agrisoli]
MDLAKRMDKMQASQTAAAAAKARELKAKGIDVISLAVGEPDFNTPEYILDQVKEDMYAGRGHHYTDGTGIVELKQAIIDYHAAYDNVHYSLDEVFIADGAKMILYYTFQALLNEGDEVLIPSPYWVSYIEQVNMADGVPVIVETDAKDQFRVTPELLDQYVTEKTKLLVLNSPSNPTGAILSEEDLRAVAEYCLEHNILIIADEIYYRLVYNGHEAHSIAGLSQAIKENTIVINGFSKAYAMTGWRLGYALAENKYIKAYGKLASQINSNPSGLSQYAGLAALKGSDSHREDMRLAFEKRLNAAYDELLTIPGFVLDFKPQGAFYLFPDCSEAARNCGYDSVTDFADAIIEEAHVVGVAGVAFGKADHIRFSYATNEETFAEAMKRIREFVISKSQA